MYDLKEKKVLVTGSTSGLGKELAIELSKLGCKIIVHGRNQDRIDGVMKLLDGEGHSFVMCDFNNETDLIKEMGGLGGLDILINNAGMWQEGDTIDILPEDIPTLTNSNLTGAILTTRLLLPSLLKSDFSQILNVSSVAGVEIPSGYYHTVYSALKWGVQAFTEALAKEFDGKNLRVMGFYPGGMETEFFKKVGMDYATHEPWMFDSKESVEAIIFMLTRNPKVSVKRMDLINHLQG
ncbi:MAG TPA: SDR family NAD(P)-dependent oxidoreductase [Candidatus Dojkabacteria bacterium]|nr:SDR family NAD(P)-dependent oxidoreductase [Candidatus Dojkabacteria bacterium]